MSEKEKKILNSSGYYDVLFDTNDNDNNDDTNYNEESIEKENDLIANTDDYLDIDIDTNDKNITESPGVITHDKLPISKLEEPKGMIISKEELDKKIFENLDNSTKYFIFDINFDWDKENQVPYQVIFSLKDYDRIIVEFFEDILEEFVSSKDFSDIKSNPEIYPEIVTMLLSEYLQYINDDENLKKKLEISLRNNDYEGHTKIVQIYGKKIATFFNCFIKYKYKIDNNIKDFNKRTFIYDLMISNIWPNDFLKYSWFKTNNAFLEKSRLRKINVGKAGVEIIREEDYFIPDKRETFYDKSKIKEAFDSKLKKEALDSKFKKDELDLKSEQKTLSDNDYDIITNYRLIEQIEISYDFEFIVKWLAYTFEKNQIEPINNIELCKNIIMFFDEQKYNKGQNLNKTNLSNVFDEFKFKFIKLRNYFLNFNNYYNDDKYIYKLNINKEQSFYSCLKGISSGTNDFLDNKFRFMFISTLLDDK